MAFSSSLRDEQALCDLLVRHSGRDHGCHLALAPAQRSGVARRFCNGTVWMQRVVERFAGGHGLAVLPGCLAPALCAETIARLLACSIQLIDPEPPRTQ